MRCGAAILPLLSVCLFGARPALGQFNGILHKVTSEIQKAKPEKIQDALASASTSDIAGAIRDTQRQASRDDATKVVGSLKDAVKAVAGGGAQGGAPVEVTTTTTLPPGPQAVHAAEALGGASVEKIAGTLRAALQDATPKELAGKIRGAVDKPKELADQILGKDAAHVASALQDATAKDVVAAVGGGAGSAPQDAARKAAEKAAGKAAEAAKGAKETVAGLDAKGMLDAISGADADKVKGLADTSLDQYKHALRGVDAHAISGAVRNPSASKVNEAIEKMRGVARPPAPGPDGRPGGGRGADIAGQVASPRTLGALLLALAVLGGLYTLRRLTKPGPAGLPMLGGEEGFDMRPMSPASGSFFGGGGARELPSQGSASNGFTRF